MIVAYQIRFLAFNCDAFKGTFAYKQYYQKVVRLKLTCKHEILEQQSALVKLLIDNIMSESQIQQKLKALVKVKHPNTVDEFWEAL